MNFLTKAEKMKTTFFFFNPSYFVLIKKRVGKVQSIILHRDKLGFFDDWFVEHVSVSHTEEGEVHFPLNRWMPPNKPMQFEKFDSTLPQYVKERNPGLYKQREEELEQKQKDFKFLPIGGVKGMPRSVSTFYKCVHCVYIMYMALCIQWRI